MATKREAAALALAVAVLAGCATTAPDPAPTAAAAGAATDAVEQAAEGSAAAEPLAGSSAISLWETEPRPEDGLAGLAVWPGAGQRPWLLVAARDSHRLVLFDAASGELLREFGSLGERPGSFREPVDVAVAGDLAFVVERGNARVQVLRLPGLATVGFLGEGVLGRPAAVAVEPDEEGWAVWVAGETVAVEVPDDGGTETASAGVAVHPFTVSAAGSPLAERRGVLDLGRPGHVVALALAPDGAAALAAVGSPDEPLGSGLSPSLLGSRSLEVVTGPVAGAAPFPCSAGHGWLVAVPGGGLLALSPQGSAAAIGLPDVAATVVALGLAGPAPGRSAAGTLYAVTADSRVVAIDGAELAAGLGPLVCR
ncbi:MAG TPA: hypothetical protein VM617_03685 [Thermoanaerobaculia bacterium]|nr:hypothetical protein [Thermoanaerobaculia bacterium]